LAITGHAHAIETWFTANARDLPWRVDRTPWRAFVSEIMLQQTQAARVAERFDALIEEFPTPSAMANAPLDALLMHWQGLGYYRRARSLHAASQRIVEDFNGETPSDAASLLALPGIGRYSAGAIASIAGGHREAIVDGNVRRVLARLHGDDAPSGDRDLEVRTWNRAQALVDACKSPMACNEGLMELGATVCTPRKPKCDVCPLASKCKANASGNPAAYPAPRPTKPKPTEHVHALVVQRGGRVLLERRPNVGRWAGTWQTPTFIDSCAKPPKLVARHLELARAIGDIAKGGAFEHVLTHRRLLVRVFFAEALPGVPLGGPSKKWVRAQSPGVPLSALTSRVLQLAIDRQLP
jgi:A/G-specific adenine glycosylase